MNFNINTSMVPAEQLIALGKTAAQTAETSGMSLTDAVVRAIGMTKLNEQQVRRVVESANHEAFHRKFASMDSAMRVVELDGGPADPAEVMERLGVAAQPMKMASRTSHYSAPPQRNAAFAPYSETYTKQAALAPVYELRSQLMSAHTELAGQMAARQFEVEQSIQKLAYATTQAVHEGAYFEDLEAVWGALNPKLATEMLGALQPRRAPEGVKTSSRRIVDSAAVVTAFQKFAQAAESYELSCAAVRAMEQELIRVDSFLEDR